MIPLLLIVFSCGYWRQTTAAPIPTEYVTWQNEPYGRGTWSILSSCVTTLVLCVYTAVHMNVRPAYEDPKLRKWHTMIWVLWGVFAPELVVWAAWCQLSEAKKLTKEIEDLRAELDMKDEPTVSHAAVSEDIELMSSAKQVSIQTAYNGDTEALEKLLKPWTLQHSFFVLMGGYQFRPEALDDVFHHPKGPRMVIGRECLLYLLRNGYADRIPPLPPRDLADRSKADSLAKFLSCVQGIWLILQLLGRVIGRLTITELEVNTFAHILCAIAMYAFWMHKPLNVQQPVFVTSHGLETWLSVQNTRFQKLYEFSVASKESASNAELPMVHAHDMDTMISTCLQCGRNLALSENREIYNILLGPNVNMTPDEIALALQQNNADRYVIDFVRGIKRNTPEEDVDNFRGELYRSREEFLADDQDVKKLLKTWSLADRDFEFERRDRRAAPSRVADMIPDEVSTMKFLLMVAVSSIYGGLHASLWNHHFPTAAEMWIWRISSLIVASNGLLVILVTSYVRIVDLTPEDARKVFWGHDLAKPVRYADKVLDDALDSDILGILMILMSIMILVLLTIFQVVFALCRIFLFIDAFLTLRSQPPSAYQTPQWTQWLPHL